MDGVVRILLSVACLYPKRSSNVPTDAWKGSLKGRSQFASDVFSIMIIRLQTSHRNNNNSNKQVATY